LQIVFYKLKVLHTSVIRLYHPLDGITNPKYKLLHFLTANFFCKEKKALAFNRDRFCHLCLWLILFHLIHTESPVWENKNMLERFCPQQTFFSLVSQEPTQAVSRVNHLLAFTQNIRRGWKCSSATINDLFFTVSLQKTFYNQS
jgi:hypothetical protein